jgi:hypothetical protein
MGFTQKVFNSLLTHYYSFITQANKNLEIEGDIRPTLLYTTTPTCPSSVPNYITAVVTLILAACFYTTVEHNPTVLPTFIHFNLPGVINENDNSNGFSNPQLRPSW